MAEPQPVGRSGLVSRPPVPQEHGSWLILFGPALLGSLVAGRFRWATLLVLLAGLMVFLLRQPLRGEGGRLWFFVYGGLALLSGLPLLALHRELIWLAPIGAAALFVEWWGGRGLARRSLAWQLLGSAGLCLMGPATYVASGGPLGPSAWGLYLLSYVGFGLGVAYVALLLRWVKAVPLTTAVRWQTGWWLPVGALVGLLLCWLLGRLAWLPRFAYLALLPVVLRSLWAVPWAPRVTRFKRVGQIEAGFSALFVTLAALLW